MRIGLLIIAFVFIVPTMGQLDRGRLLENDYPDAMTHYIQNDRLRLEEVRRLTNFLRDRNLTSFDNTQLPKRKKAFMRHIKSLSEQLERCYFNDQIIGSAELEILYELLLFYHSFLQSAEHPSGQTPPFSKKVSMYWQTKTSRYRMRWKIEQNEDYLRDPIDSPYWNQVYGKKNMRKRFDELAKLKKIRPKKEMIVVFKKLSYTGSAPKVRTLDLDYDNEWSLKWGDEVHTDVVGSRIFAALGYDVDHPYYYGQDSLILVFDFGTSVLSANDLRDSLKLIYGFDIEPFISKTGVIDDDMIFQHKRLSPYRNRQFVSFKKCAVEGRPDRVKRIGSFLPNDFHNDKRRALRGALLAHAWIDNWDVREENTLLTTVHDGNYNYTMSASFSDLGTCMGVRHSTVPIDFKVGLVNAFEWEVAMQQRGVVYLRYRVNDRLAPYAKAEYSDMKWMAMKIAQFDEEILRSIVNKSGWPYPVRELYFHKLAARRASILTAFDIEDPNSIEFDSGLTIEIDGSTVVKNGRLVVDYQRDAHPESFYSKKGRLRNYGN
jgi:hypothetical protein